jgi:hypothetical protein
MKLSAKFITQNIGLCLLMLGQTSADYIFTSCQKCSTSTTHLKVCNLANDANKFDSNAKLEDSVCCTPDDTSKFCKNEEDGGHPGNECSEVADIWAAVDPQWYTFCSQPKAKSNCGRDSYTPSTKARTYENSKM